MSQIESRQACFIDIISLNPEPASIGDRAYRDLQEYESEYFGQRKVIDRLVANFAQRAFENNQLHHVLSAEGEELGRVSTKEFVIIGITDSKGKETEHEEHIMPVFQVEKGHRRFEVAAGANGTVYRIERDLDRQIKQIATMSEPDSKDQRHPLVEGVTKKTKKSKKPGGFLNLEKRNVLPDGRNVVGDSLVLSRCLNRDVQTEEALTELNVRREAAASCLLKITGLLLKNLNGVTKLSNGKKRGPIAMPRE